MRSEIIMKVKKGIMPWWILFAWSTMWGIFFLSGGIGLFLFAFFFGMIMYPLLGSIIMHGLFGKLFANRIAQEAEEAFTKFIGSKPKYFDVGCYAKNGIGVSGTGIAYNDGKLFLLEAGRAIEVPWSKVRSWSREEVGSEQFTSFADPTTQAGMAAGMATLQSNVASRANAAQASGLFVKIANIDQSSWHFQTQKENILNKWFEIFSQLNDHGGRLPDEKASI